MNRKKVLSGMRPTGSLHLGNLLGALNNWVELQNDFDCYYFVADWHAFTTPGKVEEGVIGYENVAGIAESTREMVVDWLAAGLDPQKCCIYLQSGVPEVSELYLMFSLITPFAWLQRNPTVLEQIEQLKIDSPNHGLYGYPVLQAADILIVKSHYVPVGKDQEKHIELSREIARRFNGLFGEVFPLPQGKFTEQARVVGIDSIENKMSKSANNHISLSFDEEETRERVKRMFTDPKKVHKHDPGNPYGCVVYSFHEIYSKANAPEIEVACKGGQIGCVECKDRLANNMNQALRPIRDKRQEILANPDLVDEVLSEGTRKARQVAAQTIDESRAAMSIPVKRV